MNAPVPFNRRKLRAIQAAAASANAAARSIAAMYQDARTDLIFIEAEVFRHPRVRSETLTSLSAWSKDDLTKAGLSPSLVGEVIERREQVAELRERMTEANAQAAPLVALANRLTEFLSKGV